MHYRAEFIKCNRTGIDIKCVIPELHRLDSVCEQLLFGDASSVLDPRLVEGEWVHHNVTKITSRGVVQAPESHPDDLPNWILTAMKCMAHCKYLHILSAFLLDNLNRVNSI